MFVDDALLYKVIRSSSNTQDLRMNVDVFAKWIDEHDLHLNVNKFKSLLLSWTQELLCTFTITVNDHPIENVCSYKYLLGSSHPVIYPGAIIVTVRQTTCTFYFMCETTTGLCCFCLGSSLVKDVPALKSVQWFASKVCTKSWSRRDVRYNKITVSMYKPHVPTAAREKKRLTTTVLCFHKRQTQ